MSLGSGGQHTVCQQHAEPAAHLEHKSFEHVKRARMSATDRELPVPYISSQGQSAAPEMQPFWVSSSLETRFFFEASDRVVGTELRSQIADAHLRLFPHLGHVECRAIATADQEDRPTGYTLPEAFDFAGACQSPGLLALAPSPPATVPAAARPQRSQTFPLSDRLDAELLCQSTARLFIRVELIRLQPSAGPQVRLCPSGQLAAQHRRQAEPLACCRLCWRLVRMRRRGPQAGPRLPQVCMAAVLSCW